MTKSEEANISSANQMLEILRGLKDKIKSLEAQKYALALSCMNAGCPENAKPHCPLRAFEPKRREPASCAQCWMKYADKFGKKIEEK